MLVCYACICSLSSHLISGLGSKALLSGLGFWLQGLFKPFCLSQKTESVTLIAAYTRIRIPMTRIITATFPPDPPVFFLSTSKKQGNPQ